MHEPSALAARAAAAAAAGLANVSLVLRGFRMRASALPAGFMVDLISDPVTSGFTSAYSVMIAVSQVKGLLGLRFKAHGFVHTLSQLFGHIHEAKLADSLLGVGCIAVLLAMKVCPFPLQRHAPLPLQGWG